MQLATFELIHVFHNMPLRVGANQNDHSVKNDGDSSCVKGCDSRQYGVKWITRRKKKHV